MERRACIATILLPLATLRLHLGGSGLFLLHVSFPSEVNITIERSDLPGTQRGGGFHVPAADAPRE